MFTLQMMIASGIIVLVAQGLASASWGVKTASLVAGALFVPALFDALASGYMAVNR